MATVTIRVPDDLKKRMDEVDENWSEVLRAAVEERLRRRRRAEAIRETDRLREAIFRRTGRYSHLSREVLKWRRLH